jgi:hypothetical protein
MPAVSLWPDVIQVVVHGNRAGVLVLRPISGVHGVESIATKHEGSLLRYTD